MSKNKDYELAIKIAGEIEKSFYDSTKLTKKELQDMAKEAVRTAKAASGMAEGFPAELAKQIRDSEPAFQQLEKISGAAFSAMKSGAVAAAASISAVTSASMAVGMNFEEQMSAVQAISMSTNDEMNLLREEAKNLGKATKFSAAEVGQGFEYMAMAGWKTQDMLEGIDGVLSLAAASGEELGTVSDIVTDAMTAFGLGADEVNRFADVLAVASSSSNTNVSMMGETFKYVAPLAGAMGYSIEDTAVAIGLMANSGIKASQAGTALRSMLSRLNDPTKEVRQAMKMLNFSLTDDKGNMKSMLQMQKDLREGFKNINPAQASQVASKLAGDTAMSGLLAIVNASDEDFEKLTGAINDSAGAAEKMAGIRLDNLKGDLTVLKSAAEGFGIELYEGMAGPAREAVQYATGFLGEFTESVSRKLPTARREIIQFGQGVSEMAQPMMTLGKWLLDNPGVITGPIAGIGTSLAVYKTASGVMSLASSLRSFGAVGMGILGLGGVAAVITGISTSVKKAAVEAKNVNLAAHFGDISLSLSELQETAAALVQNQSLDQVRESVAAMGEADAIADDIRAATREIDKLNWKVSVGLELTDQEKENYQREAEAFVEATQEYVTQKQYGVSLAVNTLLGDDLENSNVVDQINEFYSGKQQELADLGKQLNETITDAFTDGLLDMDEVAEIAKLQEQMAHIKSALAGSDFEAGMDLIRMKYSGQDLDADSFMNIQAEILEQMSEAIAAYDEAYKTAMSEYRMMLSEGEWSQQEFDKASGDLNKGYLQQKADLQAKAVQFQVDTIKQAYGEEIRQFQEETGVQFGDMLYKVAHGYSPNAHMDWLGENIVDSVGLDQSTRDSMGDLFESMEPLLEQMQETERLCREAGLALPEAIREGLSDTNAIGAMSGDADAMWEILRETAVSEEYQSALRTIKEAGGYIPEQLADAIIEKQDMICEAIIQSWAGARDVYNQTFGQGLGAPVSVMAGVSALYAGNSGVKAGHADGGIFATPHVAWFAEEGPEAAIPLDRSRNAIDLWLKTGELLGMDGLTGGVHPVADNIESAAYSGSAGQELQIIYNPTIQINGSASKEDIEDVMDTEQEKFARRMEQYMKDNNRLKW